MSEFERARDRGLLQRFRAGDRDGFAELYRVHSRAIYRFAMYLSADEPKAAELTQDVFVWFIGNADRYDEARGALDSFLIGVARTLAKRRQREEHRWVELEERAMAAPSVYAEEHDVARLRRAITHLPLRYREVVALCDLEEKSYEEAATLLECSIGTIRSRLHRARALLARKLLGHKCAV